MIGNLVISQTKGAARRVLDAQSGLLFDVRRERQSIGAG